MVIPIGQPLRTALDAARAAIDVLPVAERPTAPTILVTSRGTAWTRDGFKTSWRKACAAAGVADVTFHDLRGTVVTRLAIAGASPPEIATLTGHSLRDVNAILDRHYLNRDIRLAQAAIGKLESGAQGTARRPAKREDSS